MSTKVGAGGTAAMSIEDRLNSPVPIGFCVDGRCIGADVTVSYAGVGSYAINIKTPSHDFALIIGEEQANELLYLISLASCGQEFLDEIEDGQKMVVEERRKRITSNSVAQF